MKILHVNKFLYRRGGAEGYMEDVAALQVAAGHEVAFFGMQHPENPPMPYEAHFPSHVELDPAPAGLGAKVQTFGRMVWSTSARRGMAAVLEDFRPDLVHLHNVYHQLSPSILRPVRQRGIAAVMTLHDYKLACPTYQLLCDGQVCEACIGGRFAEAVRRRCAGGSLAASAAAAIELGLHTRFGAYGAVDRFLCPSAFLAGRMEAAGVYPDRLRVLDNFTDVGATPVKSSPGGGLAYAGRLSSEKGVDVLVRAVGRLPGATLDVAGDGPERAALEALAAAVAPGRVRFHGRLPKDDALNLVRAAVAAVVPARWHENQPLAVLEAFASGVPVVATTLGGLPDLITDGEVGRLVPPDDVDALARTLGDLLADPDAAAAMGRAARARAEDRFSPHVHLRALDGHYADALGRTEVAA